jgi:hypothetical protein
LLEIMATSFKILGEYQSKTPWHQED